MCCCVNLKLVQKLLHTPTITLEIDAQEVILKTLNINPLFCIHEPSLLGALSQNQRLRSKLPNHNERFGTRPMEIGSGLEAGYLLI